MCAYKHKALVQPLPDSWACMLAVTILPTTAAVSYQDNKLKFNKKNFFL